MEPNTPQSQVSKPGVYQGIPPTNQATNSVPVVAPVIRTMKGDMADAITKQNETAASIALAETRKQEAQRAAALAAKQAEEQAKAAALAALPPQKSHKLAITLSIVFGVLLIGGGAAYVFLAARSVTMTIPYFGTFTVGKQPAPVSNVPTGPVFAPSLIPPQTEKRFAVSFDSPERVVAAIAADRTGGLSAGNFENFYFADSSSSSGSPLIPPPISSNRMFSFLGVQAPGSILRSLESHFMVGLLGRDGSVAVPFLVLKITDFDASRAGMLEWEPTLSQSFDQIFSTKLVATTPDSASFRDIIIAGRDARMINTGTDTGIAYAYADPLTIVITGSRSSLGEVLPHLTKSF